MSQSRRRPLRTPTNRKKDSISIISSQSPIPQTPFASCGIQNYLIESYPSQNLFRIDTDRSILNLNASTRRFNYGTMNQQGIQDVMVSFNNCDEQLSRHANGKTSVEEQGNPQGDVDDSKLQVEDTLDEEYNRTIDYYYKIAADILQQLRKVQKYIEQQKRCYSSNTEATEL